MSRLSRPTWTQEIALVISDIDGTLVTPDKVLTRRAIEAVRRLSDAGIGFTLISSRPPRGMAAQVAALDVRLPFAAFNGGALTTPAMVPIERYCLTPEVARGMLGLLDACGVDAWVFADDDWLLRDAQGPNVPRERRAVGFDPVVVDAFDGVLGRIGKLVGVCNDPELLAQVEADAVASWGQAAAIQRSQPYYLDVTHPMANKGDGASALAALIGIDLARTAVIGDMFNDVAMFARAGVSIAMGQAPPQVKAKADVVTLANTEDGFAHAVDLILRARDASEAGRS